jgi:hypothetical protein
MTGTENKKKNFTILSHMAMTKGVYNHGLTPIRGCAQGQQFYQKIFLLFESSFFHFLQHYIYFL